MNTYGPKQLIDSMRTVPTNTILVAEDIPEKNYGYRPTSESRSVAETLVHIASLRTKLLHRRRPVKIHPRVNRVLKYLRQKIGISDDFSLKTLAGISGLSRSHFMHVFTESVGVPLRPYILWLRLQRAACDLTDGASVTSAAHNAGFSDAAHLSRAFRRMLGMTPTDLALRKPMTRGVSLDRIGSSVAREPKARTTRWEPVERSGSEPVAVIGPSR